MTKREQNNKKLIKDTIAEYVDQTQGGKKSKVFHNTELLMKNYSVLKQHAECAVYELKEDLETDIDFDEFYIQSILKSKIRTTVMLQHVDMALELLKQNCVNKGKVELDKYDALVGIYILEKTYEELAEQYDCEPLTIRRRKNEMLQSLGLLLFGIDGLLAV